jgi:hypothetical protein
MIEINIIYTLLLQSSQAHKPMAIPAQWFPSSSAMKRDIKNMNSVLTSSINYAKFAVPPGAPPSAGSVWPRTRNKLISKCLHM